MTKDRDAVALGKRVREARLQRGLSLREMAVLTGRGRGHLSRIENGTIPNLPVPTLRMLARALKVPPSTLLGEPCRAA